MTDRFRINAGLRYDHETQERGAIQTVIIDRILPDPANLPIPALAPIVRQLNALLTATAAGANSVEPVRPVTYQAWLPKIGMTYDLAQGVSLSFTAQRGYRAAYYQNMVDQAYRDIAGRTLVNAKIGWQGEHFGAFLIASNIFDVQKPSQFFTDFDGRVRGTLTEPRILGLSFEGRF